MEYMVASGKSILTRAGQVNEYQPVTAKMIGNGSIFDGLIRIGTIVAKDSNMDPSVRPNVHKVDLRPVAKAKVKSVEIIEPEVIEVGKPDMPDETSKRKYAKKTLFGVKRKTGKGPKDEKEISEDSENFSDEKSGEDE